MPLKILLALRATENQELASSDWNYLKQQATKEISSKPEEFKGHNILALTCYGLMLREGKTISRLIFDDHVIVQRDYESGSHWIKKGAERGCPLAHLILGNECYENGQYHEMMKHYAVGFFHPPKLTSQAEQDEFDKHKEAATQYFDRREFESSPIASIMRFDYCILTKKKENAESWLSSQKPEFEILRALEGCKEPKNTQQAVIHMDNPQSQLDARSLFQIIEVRVCYKSEDLANTYKNYFLGIEYLAAKGQPIASLPLAFCYLHGWGTASQLVYTVYWLQNYFKNKKNFNVSKQEEKEAVTILTKIAENPNVEVRTQARIYLFHYFFLEKEFSKANEHKIAIQKDEKNIPSYLFDYFQGEVAYLENRWLDAMHYYQKAGKNLPIALYRLAECGYEIDSLQTEFADKAALAHQMAAEQKPPDTYTLYNSRNLLQQWSKQQPSLVAIKNALLQCIEREKKLRDIDNGELVGYHHYADLACKEIKSVAPVLEDKTGNEIQRTLKINDEGNEGNAYAESKYNILYDQAVAYKNRDPKKSYETLQEGVKVRHLPSLLLLLDFYMTGRNYEEKNCPIPDLNKALDTAVITFKAAFAQQKYTVALQVICALVKIAIFETKREQVIWLMNEGLVLLTTKITTEEDKKLLRNLVKDTAQLLGSSKQTVDVIAAVNSCANLEQDIWVLFIGAEVLVAHDSAQAIVKYQKLFIELMRPEQKDSITAAERQKIISDCCADLEKIFKQNRDVYVLLLDFYSLLPPLDYIKNLMKFAFIQEEKMENIEKEAEDRLVLLADKNNLDARLSFVQFCFEKAKNQKLTQSYEQTVIPHLESLLKEEKYQKEAVGYAKAYAKDTNYWNRNLSKKLSLDEVRFATSLEHADFVDCELSLREKKDDKTPLLRIRNLAENGKTFNGKGYAICYLAKIHRDSAEQKRFWESDQSLEYNERAIQYLDKEAIAFVGKKNREALLGFKPNRRAFLCSFLSIVMPASDSKEADDFLLKNKDKHAHAKFYFQLLSPGKQVKEKNPRNIFNLILNPQSMDKSQREVLEEIRDKVMAKKLKFDASFLSQLTSPQPFNPQNIDEKLEGSDCYATAGQVVNVISNNTSPENSAAPDAEFSAIVSDVQNRPPACNPYADARIKNGTALNSVGSFVTSTNGSGDEKPTILGKPSDEKYISKKSTVVRPRSSSDSMVVQHFPVTEDLIRKKQRCKNRAENNSEQPGRPSIFVYS